MQVLPICSRLLNQGLTLSLLISSSLDLQFIVNCLELLLPIYMYLHDYAILSSLMTSIGSLVYLSFSKLSIAQALDALESFY